MPYFGPSTEKSAHSCDKCKHFGHWVAEPGLHVWCLDGKYVNAMPYAGCVYWKPGFIGPANAVEPEMEKGPSTRRQRG